MLRIGYKFYSDVRKRLEQEESGNEPKHLNAGLARGATARWRLLTNELWFRTIPSPQIVVQLHGRDK